MRRKRNRGLHKRHKRPSFEQFAEKLTTRDAEAWGEMYGPSGGEATQLASQCELPLPDLQMLSAKLHFLLMNADPMIGIAATEAADQTGASAEQCATVLSWICREDLGDEEEE